MKHGEKIEDQESYNDGRVDRWEQKESRNDSNYGSLRKPIPRRDIAVSGSYFPSRDFLTY
jgi:hypothetical protein